MERNFNSGHDNHNEKLDTWLKEPGREHLIITRGSDCHEIPQVGLVDFVIDEDVKNRTGTGVKETCMKTIAEQDKNSVNVNSTHI